MLADPHAKDLAAAMLEEWKILQAKVDKIGEFRFHIKNWAVTVAVAFIIGVYVTYALPWLVLAALVPTWAFFLVENRQQKILHVLMTRAERLELAMQRLATSMRTEAEMNSLKELLGAVGSVPGTAGALRTFSRSRRFDRWIFNEANFYIALSLFISIACACNIWRMEKIAKKETAQAQQTEHSATNNTISVIGRLKTRGIGMSYADSSTPGTADFVDILSADYIRLHLGDEPLTEGGSENRSQ
jgi:Flp pilus assembly protein TadB